MGRITAVVVVAVYAFVCDVAIAANNAKPDGPAVLMQLVARSDDPQLQLDVLRGVHAALEGRRNVAAPAGWSDVYAKLSHSKDAELRSLTREVASIYGDKQAIAEMRKTLEDASADAEERRSVLRSLLAVGEPSLAPTLQRLVNDASLRDAALTGLAAYDDARTPAVILAAYEKLDLPARRAALNTLAGRLAYARELTAAVKDNRVSKADLTAYTIRQLRDLGDDKLNHFVDEVYGIARAASADKAKQIADYKQMLTDNRLAKADPSSGRVIFSKTCAQCHTLYGTGGTVGPDLTGSQRANLDYVLQNVVDPSSLIAREYQVTLVRTKDKRVISGIATETAAGYKIVTETGVVQVPKEQVDKVKKSDLSMMPEGLLNGMKDTEVTDLVAYLRTTSQVPLPEGSKPH
jgi:putative heme-binding domain-containing protein